MFLAPDEPVELVGSDKELPVKPSSIKTALCRKMYTKHKIL